MKKMKLEEVYNFLKGIKFTAAGYSAQLKGVWVKEGDWLSFFIKNMKDIKEGMGYTLIAQAIVEGGGYTAEGAEVYMASTPLKSGNLLIEVKISDPYIDDQEWVARKQKEFCFLC